MKYGLENHELQKLNDVFRSFPNLMQVRLYGSRAKGNYKPFSDVDITLEGDGVSHDDLMELQMQIDDLLLPYFFDISIFKDLKNQELINHINRKGIVIFKRGS